MPEQVVKDLLEGKIDSFNKLSSEIRDQICERLTFYNLREQVMEKIFSTFSSMYPEYTFRLVYNLPSYEEFCKSYLDKDISIMQNNRFFHNFIDSSSWAVDYVDKNMDRIIKINLENIFSITRYGFYNGRKDWIERLANHDNMRIRQHFMHTVIDDFPYHFYDTFPDVIGSSVKLDENGKIIEKIDEEYITKIAVLAVTNLNDCELFLKIKEFILGNYPKNTLASLMDLTGLNEDNEKLQSLLLEDIDRLFTTSSDYKWQLYKYYRTYLSDDVVILFSKKINPFADIYTEDVMETISMNGLLDDFLSLAYEFLERSTGTKCVSKAGSGSCSFAYRIGDYIIKFSDKKYSSEEEICPNSYLIAKNFAEIIKRNDYGKVTGAVEVQKFFSRKVLDTQKELLENWLNAFKEEGYILEDNLVGGIGGPNCFYLADYHDADTEDPESLPEWFKKDPIVLVDRDLVYKIGHK